MKEIWFDLYVEKLNELIDAGVDEKIADDTAALYAENRLKEYIPNLVDALKYENFSELVAQDDEKSNN
ncbi:MAG TPA: hypothetical protein VEP90_23880 [Methylomirabilota bacterium]|nr:hypothetical protein [Methylomirabilota bacterium]